MLTSLSVFSPHLPSTLPTYPLLPTQELHRTQVSPSPRLLSFSTTSSHLQLSFQDMLPLSLQCLCIAYAQSAVFLHFSFSHSLSYIDFYLLLSCILHSPFLPDLMLLSLLLTDTLSVTYQYSKQLQLQHPSVHRSQPDSVKTEFNNRKRFIPKQNNIFSK